MFSHGDGLGNIWRAGRSLKAKSSAPRADMRGDVVRAYLPGVLVVVLAASSAVALACGDDDDNGATESPTAGQDGGDGNADTGVPQLDFTLEAALRRDAIELAGLTAYQEIACEESPQGAGAPPACRENEDDGTEVQVFPVAQCELQWTRPEDVPDAYERALGQAKPEIVAVYEIADQPLDLDAEYAAVLRTPETEGAEGIALWINGGRVVELEYDCGNFEGLYADERVERFLIEP